MADAQTFLRDILGLEGSKALAKAVAREPGLSGVLTPRAIVAWLSVIPGHEGSIPGTDTHFQFAKTEAGLTGTIDLNGTYAFTNASLYHVAAAVASVLQLNPDKMGGLRDATLVRLGKSLDQLVKAQLSKKVLDPNAGYQITHEHHDLGDGEMLTQINATHGGKRVGWALLTHRGGALHPDDVNVDPEHRRQGLASAMYAHAEKVTGKTVAPSQAQQAPGHALWAGNAIKPQFGVVKAESTGPANPPTKPLAPVGAVAPTKTTTRKPPRVPALPLTRSEAAAECPLCGGTQMAGNLFVGCTCFAALAKNIHTTVYGDGFVLDFNPSIAQDEVRALVRALKG